MKSFPKLKNKLILAPMAEVTDLPFRLLCRRYGSSLAYTEQLSALAIVRENQRTLQLAETSAEDTPAGLQLFGRNSDILVEAAKKLERNFDIVDLNCGCPSKKIVAQGYGAALLQEKEKIFDIVNALVASIQKPITVKMRSGFKQHEAEEIVKVIENAGAAAITIHGRTQAQGYSGKANWDVIKQAKQAISIPVIGNGDVSSPEKAKEMLEYTKCDYIMIGRAAKSNPWIFKQILHYFETGKIIKQTKEEKLKLLQEYLELAKYPRMKIVKERAMDFTRGLDNSAKLRASLAATERPEQVHQLLCASENLL